MYYNPKYLKRTKIVATLGPSTDSKETLRIMMDRGVDVFRINFSHANHDDVKEKIKIIHSLNEEYGYNTANFADLQRPKMRNGEVEGRVEIEKRDGLNFNKQGIIGNKERVFMNNKTI